MSTALAAARKRRAPPEPVQTAKPGQQNSSTQQQQQNGFTLPQVISVIDNRLLNLEKFMKETKEQGPSQQNVNTIKELEISDNSHILDEMDSRFEILAQEISNLKDIVLKLQCYTMEVNKTLVEERINVFSDLGNVNASVNQDDIMANENQDDSLLSTMDLRNLVVEEFSQTNI
jgi:hypothetical protein